MAGGRPRTPLAHLKLTGAYRADRHGDRDDEPQADGMPKKPRGLKKHAAKLWDAIVPQLVDMGIVGEIDTTMIRTCCEMYHLYRLALAVAEAEPLNKDARISVSTYAGLFDKAATKLGISPADRTKLTIQPIETESSLSTFARKREAVEMEQILGFGTR
ncbi:Phage terminase, small subunit [Symmachiella macrocystis]|uniref:Phage terminase, small subunit n=1 Tax=Symmachiella macrocystis TaxID=2527985 RepID=A0A5C6BB00_9PLAN|nr:P27 family phage terminase small subunit [Symmachiella macrocystis]TWU08842.1 Phage terminase, small subunit [Symmachiella macrocystis]